MKGERKIAIAAIQDNKLFMVKIAGVWQLPTLRQGNWLTEERAIAGRIQKEIGCPVTILERIGDFEAEAIHGDDASHLSVFRADLRGVIFIRDPEIEEWRYQSPIEAREIEIDPIIKEKVIPALYRAGIWK